MESRHGVHTHAHQALREDARRPLSLSLTASRRDVCPAANEKPSTGEGEGSYVFRGGVWVLFGVGLCCGGEGMLREKCSGDGGDSDEWTPAMPLF